jgi:glycopeptide antibiotics resistance protein
MEVNLKAEPEKRSRWKSHLFNIALFMIIFAVFDRFIFKNESTWPETLLQGLFISALIELLAPITAPYFEKIFRKKGNV